MKHIDLLRHGSLCGGVRYRGSMEENLDDLGWQQMQSRWQQLQAEVDIIICSPLSRCAEPAQQWAKEKGISCVIMPEFQEMYYGAWEGKTKQDIELDFPNMLQQWRTNTLGLRIPDAEKIEDFQTRVLSGWQQLLSKHAHQHVLILTHSGVFRLILSHVLGANLNALRRFRVQYAAWARIEYQQASNQLMLQQYQQGLSL